MTNRIVPAFGNPYTRGSPMKSVLTFWKNNNPEIDVTLRRLTTEVIACKSAKATYRLLAVYPDANATRINNERRTPISPRGTYRF